MLKPMLKSRYAVLLLFVLFATGAALAGTPEEEMMQADRDFAAATQKQGAEGWVSFFAENGVMLRQQAIVGKQAIRAAMEPFLASKGLVFLWEPTHAEALPSGDTGYTVGRWTIKLPDKNGVLQTRTGSYITLWKKQADGSWKVWADGGSADPDKPAK